MREPYTFRHGDVLHYSLAAGSESGRRGYIWLCDNSDGRFSGYDPTGKYKFLKEDAHFFEYTGQNFQTLQEFKDFFKQNGGEPTMTERKLHFCIPGTTRCADDIDVLVTIYKKENGNPSLNFSFSEDAYQKFGNNAKKIIVAFDEVTKDKIFFLDTKKYFFPGYTFTNFGKTGCRHSIRVSENIFKGCNIKNAIGEYDIEKDDRNDLFIHLKTSM